jgi:type IV secretory pathway VirB10-like protein
MTVPERLLLWVPLLCLLAAPLAWSANDTPADPAATDPNAVDATPNPAPTPAAPDPAAGAGGSAAPDAGAAPPDEPAPAPSQVDMRDQAHRAAWVGRIRAARKSVDDARQRQIDAEVGYGKARHKRKTRGEAKRELLDEREASGKALAAAEDALDEALQEAHRAGVPPGWLREASSAGSPANQR